MMARPAWINVGHGDGLGSATATAATDTLDLVDHGLSDGDLVMVDNLSGGADGVLIPGAVYFVRNATSDSFQLSGTRGSAIKAFGSNGGADIHVAVPGYSARDLRQLDSALMFPSADGLGARSGVRPGGQDAAFLSGTTWTVRAHSGVIYPALTSTSGPYRYAQEQESGSIDPADSSNPRVDAVDIIIMDDDEDNSGQRRSRAVYTAGTPASSPVPPATPAGSIRLLEIDVPAGAGSPSATYVAPATVASGGVLPVPSDSALPTAGLYDGMTAVLRDSGLMVARHDGDWRPVAGSVLLARETLSGVVGTDGTPVLVPEPLRGMFHRYTLVIHGGASGTTPKPIVVRINGDDSDNYRANCISWNTSSGNAGQLSALSSTAFPNTGLVGNFNNGICVITFVANTLGSTGFMSWSGQGWINDGGNENNNHVWISGGRWNGSSQEPSGFWIRTNQSTNEWASGTRAVLWGHP